MLERRGETPRRLGLLNPPRSDCPGVFTDNPNRSKQRGPMSDARWSDPRHCDARDHSDDWPRVYDARDRDGNDPREALMRDLDLPCGDERELVVDRERVY